MTAQIAPTQQQDEPAAGATTAVNVMTVVDAMSENDVSPNQMYNNNNDMTTSFTNGGPGLVNIVNTPIVTQQTYEGQAAHISHLQQQHQSQPSPQPPLNMIRTTPYPMMHHHSAPQAQSQMASPHPSAKAPLSTSTPWTLGSADGTYAMRLALYQQQQEQHGRTSALLQQQQQQQHQQPLSQQPLPPFSGGAAATAMLSPHNFNPMPAATAIANVPADSSTSHHGVAIAPSGRPDVSALPNPSAMMPVAGAVWTSNSSVHQSVTSGDSATGTTVTGSRGETGGNAIDREGGTTASTSQFSESSSNEGPGAAMMWNNAPSNPVGTFPNHAINPATADGPPPSPSYPHAAVAASHVSGGVGTAPGINSMANPNNNNNYFYNTILLTNATPHTSYQSILVALTNKQSLYQDRLFRQPSASVESVLAASCEVMGFDIAEMWLRTGPKTHQLTNSHLRPTALEDSVRRDLVDVYYGEKSSERTHRLSPALCKRAKEASDVVWVTANNPHGAEALRCSISNVRTAVAIPVCHEASNTNITIIFFSIRRCVPVCERERTNEAAAKGIERA